MDKSIIVDLILGGATIINYFYTYNSNRKNRAIEYANIEYTIANSLMNAKTRVEDISVDLGNLKLRHQLYREKSKDLRVQ